MQDRATERIQRSKLLRPSARAWELQRPHLLRRLEEGRNAPLSIISGLAGSGKSTLARQWSAEHDAESVWVTLDEGDNELGRFVQVLVAAIRGLDPGLGVLTLAELGSGPSLVPDDIAAALSDELIDRQCPALIVLDDFHHIHAPEISDFLEWLIQLRPPGLHLCLVGRTDPVLPLNRYRVHFDLTEVRLAHLLLTLDETRLFLEGVIGAPVRTETVDELYKQSEGWIAGLHLAAVAARDAVFEPAMETLIDRITTISIAFFAEEVLRRQPGALLRQMVLLSIPYRISDELANHLLRAVGDEADGAVLLRGLEDRGFFLISLGDEHRWYRFHPLFRETLWRVGEQQFGPDFFREGHQRVAEWFTEQKNIAIALRHYLWAGMPETAADLVERHAQHALVTDNWLDLEGWLGQLPAELRSAHIELVLARAWILQIRGAYSAVETELSTARTLLRDARALDPDWARTLALEIDVLDAALHMGQRTPEALYALGMEAWPALVRHNRAGSYFALYFTVFDPIAKGRWDDPFSMLEAVVAESQGSVDDFALVRGLWAALMLGTVKLWFGSLDESFELATRAGQEAEAHQLARLASQAQWLLGEVAYERNELRAAIGHFATTIAEPTIGIVFSTSAFSGMALAAAHLGDVDRATWASGRMTESARRIDVNRSLTGPRVLEAEIARILERYSEASAWAHTVQIDPLQVSLLGMVPSLVKARILVEADGFVPTSLDAAESILDHLDARLARVHIHRVWVAVNTLRAILLDLRGSEDDALDLLDRTIDASRRHVRSMLDQGPLFARLLRKLIERNGAYGQRRVLLDAIESEAPPGAGAPVRPNESAVVQVATVPPTPLSEREREILDYLAQRYSNKEIAAMLGISPLTVKRHTINIYSKLGVQSRRQAVLVAFGSNSGPSTGVE